MFNGWISECPGKLHQVALVVTGEDRVNALRRAFRGRIKRYPLNINEISRFAAFR